MCSWHASGGAKHLVTSETTSASGRLHLSGGRLLTRASRGVRRSATRTQTQSAHHTAWQPVLNGLTTDYQQPLQGPEQHRSMRRQLSGQRRGQNNVTVCLWGLCLVAAAFLGYQTSCSTTAQTLPAHHKHITKPNTSAFGRCPSDSRQTQRATWATCLAAGLIVRCVYGLYCWCSSRVAAKWPPERVLAMFLLSICCFSLSLSPLCL